jgi:hypothetical protein
MWKVLNLFTSIWLNSLFGYNVLIEIPFLYLVTLFSACHVLFLNQWMSFWIALNDFCLCLCTHPLLSPLLIPFHNLLWKIPWQWFWLHYFSASIERTMLTSQILNTFFVGLLSQQYCGLMCVTFTTCFGPVRWSSSVDS